MQIVIRRPVKRRNLGFSEIDADRYFWPFACLMQAIQASGNGVRPVVVEPHSINKSILARIAKKAWPRIARLRFGRDRSYFHKAETERFPCGQRNGVLVHPGSETDRVGKINAEDVLRFATRRSRERSGAAGLAE